MRVEPSAEPAAPPNAAIRLVWLAWVLGLTHAAFSVYWALGGRWLLATVGQWAVAAAEQNPVRAGLLLGVVALVKVAGATIPVLVVHRRISACRFWRAVSWLGAVGLVLYGGFNVVVASAVLSGLIRPEGGYDRAAMVGHAVLWDPLFLAWGLTLLASLWLSRERRR
jgi:hypothetical protein